MCVYVDTLPQATWDLLEVTEKWPKESRKRDLPSFYLWVTICYVTMECYQKEFLRKFVPMQVLLETLGFAT